MDDQAQKLREIVKGIKNKQRQSRRSGKTRRIAVTSGKGGVGKSSFSLSLAVALTKLRRKVLLIDADINLGNLDILLGLNPEHLLRDVVEGKVKIQDLLLEGPGGFSILPASSGDLDLLKKTSNVTAKIEQELTELELKYDFVIVDTGAGIGLEVIDFALNSDEIFVLTTPEPTAFTDAYAVIKVLASKAENLAISVVINMVKNAEEGQQIFEKIKMVVNHFLQIDIDSAGFITKDPVVNKAIINQIPFFLLNDKCPASRNVWQVAMKLITTKSNKNPDNQEEDKSLFKKMLN